MLSRLLCAERIREGLPDAADADGFGGTAREHDVDIGARVSGVAVGAIPTTAVAADPKAARTAATRARLRGKVTRP